MHPITHCLRAVNTHQMFTVLGHAVCLLNIIWCLSVHFRISRGHTLDVNANFSLHLVALPLHFVADVFPKCTCEDTRAKLRGANCVHGHKTFRPPQVVLAHAQQCIVPRSSSLLAEFCGSCLDAYNDCNAEYLLRITALNHIQCQDSTSCTMAW